MIDPTALSFEQGHERVTEPQRGQRQSQQESKKLSVHLHLDKGVAEADGTLHSMEHFDGIITI